MTTALAPLNVSMSEEMIRSTLLARVEVFNRSLASVLAAVATIREQALNLHKVFVDNRGVPDLFVSGRSAFDVDIYFAGQQRPLRYRDDVEKELTAHYCRQAWRSVLDEVQIWNVMGIADSRKLREQLDRGELPAFTVENVLGTITGLGSQAKHFAAVAAKEVFDFLTPSRSGLKTNDSFRIGRRVIIRYAIELAHAGSFRVHHSKDDRLRAMDGIFHVLDGKGPMKEGRGPLCEAINGCQGRGETAYFKFKCYKNLNLHIEFKRLDLVKELNFVAAGERVLGSDVDE